MLIAGPLAVVISLAVLWKIDAIRPGSLRRAGHEPPEPGAALPLSILALMVYLLPAVLALTILASLGVEMTGERSLRQFGMVSLATYGLGVVACVAAGWWAVRAGWLRAASTRPALRDLWIGPVAIALAWPLLWLAGVAAHAAASLAGHEPSGSLQHGTLDLLTAGDRASPWWWAVLAGAVLGAPIVEEVVFRGLLQPALRAVLGPWSAVLISAGLFTLLHVPHGAESSGATWLAIPTLAVLAITLGIARERTGRLGVPIAMHIAFNAANVALAFWLTSSA